MGGRTVHVRTKDKRTFAGLRPGPVLLKILFVERTNRSVLVKKYVQYLEVYQFKLNGTLSISFK